MNDLLAVRLLWKSPAFAIVAILSLAVGVGANTAVFSLVNDFLLRTLPVRNPDQLVLLRSFEGPGGAMSRTGENNGGIDPVTGRPSSTAFSLDAFNRLRTAPSALSDVFAFAPFSQVNVLVGGQPDVSASAQFVSGNYYTALGVPAALGRTLTDADDRPVSPPAAVISFRYWARRFASAGDVLGRVIDVNRVPTTIVGVAAQGFDGTMQAGESPDISVPLMQHLRFQPDRDSRAQPWYWWVEIMGRLKQGATRAQVRASLEPVFQQAARAGWLAGAGAGTDASAQSMPGTPTLAADPGSQGENDLRRQYEGSLRLLMGLVGLVLAAACANVANLLLARGTARQREIAVRLAIGASRTRIVRQLMIEALFLAACGSALGLVMAWAGRGLLLALHPFGNNVLVLDMPLDTRVLAFTAAMMVATAVAFGLVPALRATRMDLSAQLESGARLRGGGTSRASGTLMIVQVALSLVLLVGTGLFVRTLVNLEGVPTGFNRRNLVLFRIDAASAGYKPTDFVGLQARLQERLGRIPGVRGVTFSSTAVLSRVRQNRRIAIAGQVAPTAKAPIVNTNGLAANFFSTLELPILLGRSFLPTDTSTSDKVAIVNQAFVRQYLNGRNPIGRALAISSGYGDAVEIVGVAADAQYTDLRSAPPPTVYLPSTQQIDGNANFALRVDGASAREASIFAAVRAAVQDIDSTLPVLNLRTQDEQIDRLNAQERLFARLSGMFGTAALLLAAVGLYGLMSHNVLRRTGEIGLRMALGAPPARVLRMVLRESLTLVITGIVVGAVAALAAARLVRAMLFGLTTSDPITYIIAAVVLLVVGTLAALIPARRASHIEPLVALKE